MRKNLDDNFTYELGLNLVIFEMKSPSISHDKACLTVFDKQIHIFKDSFSIIISEKKIIKYVFICRNFTFIHTIS